MTKIIMLDFDDVILSERTAVIWGWGPDRQITGKELLHNIENPRLDPVAVGLVRKLCDETDAKIVLSTSWRDYFTIQAFIDMFSKYYNWNDAPIIDKTYWVRMSAHRSSEIDSWLEDHPEVTHYVILDDIDLTVAFPNNMVHVKRNNGLSLENYIDALEILTKKVGEDGTQTISDS